MHLPLLPSQVQSAAGTQPNSSLGPVLDITKYNPNLNIDYTKHAAIFKCSMLLK